MPRRGSVMVLAAVALAGLGLSRGQARGEAPRAGVLAPAASVTIQRDGQMLSFTTAVEAVAKAAPGDVIVLGPGTHRGPLIVTASKLTLRGEAGARVNANDASWAPQWRHEPDIAPYAYSAAIGFEPVAVTVDQRLLINAKASRGELDVHRDGIGRGGRSPLGGLYTYLADAGRVVVSFAHDTDPSRHTIEASARRGAIEVVGADHCNVEGLIATGAASGVLLERTTGTTVKNCLLYAVDAGVRLYKGAAHCRVLACDLTWNQDALHIDADPNSGLAGDDVWMAHKRFGTYDKWGILIDQAGDNNEIAGNYIYDVWNGIQNGDGLEKPGVKDHYTNYVFKGITRYNRGLHVHHNRIDLVVDDALEPTNDLTDHRWHSNVVTRARCAARLKTIAMGPFFFHDNVLIQNGDGLRLYKSSPESAKVFIYNNVVQNDTGVIYHAMDSVCWDDPWLKGVLPKGTPGFGIYNNVFLCDVPFANQHANVTPNFKADGNVYTAPPVPGVVLRGIDTHSTFDVPASDLTLERGRLQVKSSSPAAGKGADLAGVVPAVTDIEARRQPGTLAGSLDATPTGPVSGLWDLAREPLALGERDVTKYSLSPLRWVAGPKQTFIVAAASTDRPIALALTSFGRGKTAYRVTVLSDAGQVLAEKSGVSQSDRIDLSIADLPAAAQPLKVVIDDSAAEGQWKVDAGEHATVGIDASDFVALRKYDGGRYMFDYVVPTPAPATIEVSFRNRYDGPSRAQVARPDGTVEDIGGGAIATHGVAGTYRIMLTFVKKADVKVAGPSTTLVFNAKQETVSLRPRWGKPTY